MDVAVTPAQELAGEEFYAIDEYFPDREFRAYVSKNFDKDGDGRLSEAECIAVTEIDVTFHQTAIYYLDGVKLFVNLEKLVCRKNAIEEVDVSGLKLLKHLDCSFNYVETLNVSGCSALAYLDCDNNDRIDEIDLADCAALEEFYCNSNLIETLDFTCCPAIQKIECKRNQLTELKVNGCRNLTLLDCEFNALTTLELADCENLSTVYVNGQQVVFPARIEGNRTVYTIGAGFEGADFGGGTYDPANGTVTLEGKPESFTYGYPTGRKGVTMRVTVKPTEPLPKLIPIDEASFPDACYRDYVARHDTDKDGYLSDEERMAVKDLVLNMRGGALGSLEGVQLFPCMISMQCAGSVITELNLRGMSALETVICFQSELTELDVRGCASLKRLECDEKHLKQLDLSDCTELTYLDCRKNALAKLDLPDGVELTHSMCDGQEITLPARYIDGKTVYAIGTGFGKANFGEGEYDAEAGTVTFDGKVADFNYVYAIDGAGHTMQVHAAHEHDKVYAKPTPATHGENGTVGAFTCGICGETGGGEAISKNAVFTLPAYLTSVEAEAFAGLPMQQVTVPAGTKAIKAGAFANCGSLRLVIFDGDTEIESGAFGKNVTFLCAPGSKPAAFAEANGIAWFSMD